MVRKNGRLGLELCGGKTGVGSTHISNLSEAVVTEGSAPLLIGDLILAVDDTDARTLSNHDVSQCLRDSGARVKLRVVHDPEGLAQLNASRLSNTGRSAGENGASGGGAEAGLRDESSSAPTRVVVQQVEHRVEQEEDVVSSSDSDSDASVGAGVGGEGRHPAGSRGPERVAERVAATASVPKHGGQPLAAMIAELQAQHKRLPPVEQEEEEGRAVVDVGRRQEAPTAGKMSPVSSFDSTLGDDDDEEKEEGEEGERGERGAGAPTHAPPPYTEADRFPVAEAASAPPPMPRLVQVGGGGPPMRADSLSSLEDSLASSPGTDSPADYPGGKTAARREAEPEAQVDVAEAAPRETAERANPPAVMALPAAGRESPVQTPSPNFVDAPPPVDPRLGAADVVEATAAGAGGEPGLADLSHIPAAELLRALERVGERIQALLQENPMRLDMVYGERKCPERVVRFLVESAAEGKDLSAFNVLECGEAVLAMVRTYPDHLGNREFLLTQLGLTPIREEFKLIEHLDQDRFDFWDALLAHVAGVLTDMCEAREGSAGLLPPSVYGGGGGADGEGGAGAAAAKRKRGGSLRRSGSRRSNRGADAAAETQSQASLSASVLSAGGKLVCLGRMARQVAETLGPSLVEMPSPSEVRMMDSDERAQLRIAGLGVDNRLRSILHDAFGGLYERGDGGEDGADGGGDEPVDEHCLEEMTQLLLQNGDLVLVRAVLSASAERVPLLSDGLLQVFEVNNQVMDLLQECIEMEIRNTSGPETLLRQNTRSVRLLVDFARSISPLFMKKVLGYTVRELTTNVQAYLLPTGRNAKVQHRVERALAMRVQEILNNLVGNLVDLPPPLRMLLYHLRSEVARVFPDHEERALRAFFFLRFFSPALTSPMEYGLTADKLTTSGMQAAMALSKILTAVVNGLPFDSARTPDYVAFNALIPANQAALTHFLDQASIPPDVNDDTFERMLELLGQKARTAYRPAAETIVRYLHRDYEAVSQALTATPPPAAEEQDSRLGPAALTEFATAVLVRRVLSSRVMAEPGRRAVPTMQVAKAKRGVIGRLKGKKKQSFKVK